MKNLQKRYDKLAPRIKAVTELLDQWSTLTIITGNPDHPEIPGTALINGVPIPLKKFIGALKGEAKLQEYVITSTTRWKKFISDITPEQGRELSAFLIMKDRVDYVLPEIKDLEYYVKHLAEFRKITHELQGPTLF